MSFVGRSGSMSIGKIGNITGYGQIASGKRINKAADDAAGLAIANKLKVRAQGTQVATQNTQAGIHVTNIADGAYDSIMDRLQSIRELSIKAMNGTNSTSDLQAIQGEIDQNLKGIGEAARNTVYNEQKLLDGSMAIFTSCKVSSLRRSMVSFPISKSSIRLWAAVMFSYAT